MNKILLDNKNISKPKKISTLLILLLIFSSLTSFSQDITITSLTTGVSGSPLMGGTIDHAIIGFQFAKAGGGGNSIQQIVITLSQNPVGKVTNPRLVESTNTSYDGGEPTVATGTFVGNTIVFDGAPDITTFDGASGGDNELYFVVVDIDPNVSGSATLQPSLTFDNVNIGNDNISGSVTGTNYSFTALATTIATLTTGVAASPLTPGATGQAVFGFSLNSNGTQIISQLNIQLTSDPASRLTTWSLVHSGDNSFATAGDNTTVPSLTFTPSATELVITGLSEDVTTGENYFLVANVAANPGGTIQASLGSSNVIADAGSATGSATGTNYSFLTVAIGSLNAGANNVALSPLIAASTGNAVFGFSLTGGGAQTVTQLNVQLSSDPASVLATWSLVRSTDTDFTTTGDNTTIGSLTFTPSTTEVVITGLSEDVSAVKNYFLVANVDASVTGATPAIQASLGAANITANVGAGTGSATGTNYSFAELTATIASLTTGVAPSPLIGGSANLAILGFSLSSNLSQNATAIAVRFDTDPDATFNTYSLVLSTDNSFATTGDNSTVTLDAPAAVTGAGPFFLTFDPTVNIALTSTAKNYFIVASVDNTVTTASSVIQPSLTAADLTVDAGITAGSSTGTDYATQALTATIASLTTGVAPSPLVAGNTNQAILGFSLSSNGSQNATLIQARFDTDPDATFNTYTLVLSTDNSFATAGDNSTVTLDAPAAVTGTGPFFLSFDPTANISLSASAKNYFIVANVDGTVTNAASVIQPSLTAADVTVDVGGVAGSSTGTDYATQALTATIASLTTGVAPSPLVGATTNLAILGFSLTSNASQNATLIQVRFDADPDATLNTYSLVLSTDNSFATTGDNSTVTLDAPAAVTGTGPYFLTFDPTANIALTTSAKNFFIVANVDGGIGTASSVIQPSLTAPDVTVDVGVTAGSATGTDYATQALTTTIALASTGVAPSPLVGGNTNQAIFGFSLTSNGSQNATLVQVRFDADPDPSLNNYVLVQSIDNSFSTTGDNTTVTLDTPPVVSGAGPFFITFDPTTIFALTPSAKYFFVVADVDASVIDASSVFQPSLTSVDVTVDVGLTAGSATGTDYSTAALTATLLAINGGTAPVQSSTVLEAGQTGRVLAGFSVVSNGTQILSSINFNTSGLLGGGTNQFNEVYLYRSTTVGVVGTQLLQATNGDGNFNDLSAVSAGNKTVSTSTVYYYLVTDIRNTVTTATAGVTVAPTATNIVFTTGGKNLLSINRSFTFTQSFASDIILSGGNVANITVSASNTAGTPGEPVTTSNSAVFATFTLRDGGAGDDLDNLPTILDELTISVENFANLDQIALFDQAGAKIGGTDKTPAASVTWTALGYTTTTDRSSGGTRNFTIRASFKTIVTDNQQTDIDIVATTTATSAGSLFAATNAGGNGTTVTANHNQTEIVATKLVFVDPAALPIINTITPYTGPVFAIVEGQPNDTFDATVAAVDANNNIDLDRVSTITLSVSPAGGVNFRDDDNGTSNPPSTLGLVAGIVTFTNLTVNLPNTYDLIANGGGLTAASGATAVQLVIQTAGVDITPAVLSMCKSNTSGAYTTLPNIVLNESNNGDFDPGSGLSFLLILPSGWEFDTTVPGTVAYTAGRNVSSANSTFTFLGNTIAKFNYSVAGTNADDAFTLSGLSVRNTGGVPTGVITKGGTGVIKGCCDDTKPLGTLDTSPSSPSDFSVQEYPGQPSVPTTQTKFPKTSAAIILNGEVPPGTPDGTIGSFSGIGVTQTFVTELSGNRYTFNPSILSSGVYNVTFSYANMSGCLSETTKPLEVFEGAINGLATSYCADDGGTKVITVNGTFQPANTTVVEDPPGSDAFSLRIPSQKYISEVVNNGGTMTLTVRNHGFVNGQQYWIYIANSGAGFSGIDAPYGYIYKFCTVSGVAGDQFNIDVNVAGNWDKYYGVVYLPSSYYNFSNVSIGATTITVTAANHGFLDGARPYMYIELYSAVFGYSFIEGFFQIQSATQNTFVITKTAPIGYGWSGYGYAQANWYRVNTLVPDVKLLNSKLLNVTSFDVGYFIQYTGCNDPGCFIYYTAHETPVQLYPLPIVSFTGLPASSEFCEGDVAVQLTGSESGSGSGSFAINPGTIADLGNGTATFDPGAQALNTNLDIEYSFTDINGCTGTSTQTTIVKAKLLSPTANDTTYCQNVLSPEIVFTKATGVPTAQFNWYADPGITSFLNSGTTFNTGLNTSVNQIKSFYVTQVTTTQCESLPTTVEVTILAQPTAAFSTNPTTLCDGKEFTAVGPTNAGTPHPKYVWNFGSGSDITVLDDNEQLHTYIGTGSPSITLTVTDVNGCFNSSSTPVAVNENPIASFDFNQVCDGDTTIFLGAGGTEYSWEFFKLDETSPPTDTILLASVARATAATSLSAPFKGTTQSPQYELTGGPSNGPGNYLATVTAYNNIGCFSDSTKRITILNYLTPTTALPYDMTQVNGGDGFWTIGDNSIAPSWQFTASAPTQPIKSLLGPNSWVTKATANYNASENSTLNSPCLNITGVLRPTLSIDFVMDTERAKDGVVMEYSIDGGVNWSNLGAPGSGLNWFNTGAFATAPIGSSNVGWSGKSETDLDDNTANDILVSGRRALDNIPGMNPKTKVRLRLAFKTDSFDEREGFGFSNVRIETRSRLLMVEHFTNENDGQYGTNKTVYDAIDPLESVKVQYHVSSPPSGDDNSKLNTADQVARAAFYGVVLTDPNIPRAYIDGFSGGSLVQAWAVDQFNKRALVPAQVNMTVASVPSTDPNYLKASVTITPQINIPALPGIKPFLHIAIAEVDDPSGNEYVFRKFMTSAIGLAVPLPLTQGVPIILEDSVLITEGMIPNNDTDVSLIAFIQDENTKSMYQAAIETGTVLPTPITGIEDPDYGSRINIFPNPANQVVNIELPSAAIRQTPVRMIDPHGRAVYEGNFKMGDKLKTISTTDLTGGVYILQIGTPDGKVARKKVMVIHR